MKNVTWQDVVKLGEMNPIIARHLAETVTDFGGQGCTEAAALLAMVDALDSRCAQLEVEARRYRYLRDFPRDKRGLFVADNHDRMFEGNALDAWLDELIELAKKAESGGEKVASEDAGS